MAHATTLPSRLLRPRHLLASVMVFLLLGGFVGGLVGYVEADAKPDQGVFPFTLATPLAGDEGRYEIVAATGHTLPDAHRQTWERSVSFQWLPDQVVTDREAARQWANMVRANTTHAMGDGSMQSRDEALALEPGGTRVIGALRIDNRTHVQEDSRTYRIYSRLDYLNGDVSLPCGLRTPLQGEPVSGLGASFGVDVLCRHSGGFRDNATRHMVVAEAGRVDGVTYFTAKVMDRWWGAGMFQPRDILVMTYQFRSDIPYPVRMESEGDSYALQLTAFERGATAVRTSPEVLSDGPRPRLEVLATASWGGPDEEGIDHPFPLSEAVRRGMEEPTFPDLRDFVASHPTAYLASVMYRDMQSDGMEGTWRDWYLTYTDGKVAQQFLVEQDVNMVLQDPPVALPMPLPERVTYRYTSWEEQDGAGYYPEPALRPAEMPTVASQWAAWQRHATPDYEAKEPNYWSFYVQCAHDCEEAYVSFAAGYTQYTRNYTGQGPIPLIAPGENLDGEVRSTLEWAILPGRAEYTFEHPASYSEDRVDWRRDGQPAPYSDPVPALAGSQRVMGSWAMPAAAETTAIGFGAFLASALYWLWPALKAGPAALFSRVRGEDLLQNALRAEMHQRIEAEPGIHHQALVRATGRSHGAVEHHIRKLVDGGLVSRIQAKGYTCYFPKGRVDYRAMTAAPLLKSPVARSILEGVRRKPGIRSGELARALDVAPATIHYHVDRMRQAGLLHGDLAQGALRLTVPGDMPV